MKLSDLFKEKIINLPNFISFLRILLLPILIYYSNFFLRNHSLYKTEVFILIVVIFLSDFFDGFLARKLNQITMLGKYLDPLADMITILCLLSILVLIKDFPLWIFFLYIFREMGTIYIGAFLFFKKHKQVLPSFIGKSTTFIAFIIIFIYYIEDFIGIKGIYGAYVFAIFIILSFIESYFRFKDDVFNK